MFSSTASASPPNVRTEVPQRTVIKAYKRLIRGHRMVRVSGATPSPHETRGATSIMSYTALPTRYRVWCTGNGTSHRLGRDLSIVTAESTVGCTEAGSLSTLAGQKLLMCQDDHFPLSPLKPNTYRHREPRLILIWRCWVRLETEKAALNTKAHLIFRPSRIGRIL